jgi:hypothetical protein
VISDHAYKMPARLNMRIGWSAASAPGSGTLSAFGITVPTFAGYWNVISGAGAAYLKQIYAELLGVQTSRALLSIYTGKRIYQNMLLQTIGTTTNEETENSLIITAAFREIILVKTQTVQLPMNQNALANPQSNAPTQQGSQQAPKAPATANKPQITEVLNA